VGKPQFTLRRLMIAMPFFAYACAVLAVPLHWRQRDLGSAAAELLLGAFLCTAVAACGAGVGVLYRQTLRGALWGLIVIPLTYLIAILALFFAGFV
jgi:hypothetical protein